MGKSTLKKATDAVFGKEEDTSTENIDKNKKSEFTLSNKERKVLYKSLVGSGRISKDIRGGVYEKTG
jgi:hypothetical protein